MTRARKAAGRLAGAMILAWTLSAMLDVTTAQAYVVHKSGSYPVTATVPKVVVTGNLSTCDPTGDCTIDLNKAYFTDGARTAYENSTYASSWQWVCFTHRLWQWTPTAFANGIIYPGHWTLAQKTNRACGWISPSGTSLSNAKFTFPILNTGGGLENFATDVIITWQLPSGYLLGKKVYDYVDQADYVCSPDPGVCTVRGYADDGSAYIGV
jgi:hypothetical protein